MESNLKHIIGHVRNYDMKVLPKDADLKDWDALIMHVMHYRVRIVLMQNLEDEPKSQA